MELGRQPGPMQPPLRSQHWWRPDAKIWRRMLRRAIDDNISATATQLAFHFTFSFFPLLMVLASVLTQIDAPFLFARIMLALNTVLPPSATTLIRQVLDEVRRGSGWHVFLTGLSLAAWSSVSGLHVLICAINGAHGVIDDRPYWKRSLLALGMTLFLAVLLVAATALVIGGRWLGIRISTWLGHDEDFVRLWVMLRWPVILLAVISGLLILYTAAPKLPISAWRALPGAILGGTGWVIATTLFGWYINMFASYNKVYGSIGGMIVLMLWLYVGGIVILLGAELNGALYLRRRDHT